MFNIAINKKTNGCTIIGFLPGIHSPLDLIIPEEISGHRVERIAERAFVRRSFKRVDIQAKINSINANTFLSCPKLEMCCLPNSIKEIQKRSFFGCKSLRAIAFSNSTQLDKISREAFHGCSQLESLLNLQSCRVIEYEAFYDCKNFGCIPFTFEEAGDRTFLGSGIDSLVITDKTKKIGASCFSCCDALETLIFDRSVPFNRIASQAFYNCESLKKVLSIGDNSQVKQIGDNAFDACFKLHQFDLVPQNVIGDYAFRGCNCLKGLKASDKIKRIGKHIPCDVEFI